MLISLSRPDNLPALDLVSETNYQPMPDYMLHALTTFARGIRNQMVLADRRR